MDSRRRCFGAWSGDSKYSMRGWGKKAGPCREALDLDLGAGDGSAKCDANWGQRTVGFDVTEYRKRQGSEHVHSDCLRDMNGACMEIIRFRML